MLISSGMSQIFQPGDFLVFQLEAGFALLRVLAFDDETWHVAAYSDLFADVESAESATDKPASLNISSPHIALTQRAFESTQVAKIANQALTAREIAPLDKWRGDPEHVISDRSIRLLLGLR